MKVAITAQGDNLASNVDLRFGRCRYFILVDTDSDEVKALDNTDSANLAGGAGIQAAELVANSGAGVLITGHCGPKAFRTLNAAGVKVVIGAEGTVEQALESFKRGELKSAAAPDVRGHW